MQTRRGFFGAACAAIAAVSGAMTAAADIAVVQRTRTYIRMQYRANTWPASFPVALRSQDMPTEYVVVCTGSRRHDLEKFVYAMRDTVWSPKLRRKVNKDAVKIYMAAYEHMLTGIEQCETTGEYQMLYYTTFLVDCTPDLPTKLLEYDVVLHDDGTDTVMRRFKSSTKHGRTKIREVIRTKS